MILISPNNLDHFVDALADEVLRFDTDKPSQILTALSDDELRVGYDNVLKQFGLELAIGSCEDSQWIDGNLVIQANEEPIHFLQVAFYAIRLEMQRRKRT